MARKRHKPEEIVAKLRLDLPGDGGGPVVHYAAARSKAMGLT